jgi:PAS domain S-box-containing protein
MAEKFLSPSDDLNKEQLIPRAKILVVEDDLALLELYQKQIENLGHDTVSTESVENAIKILEAENFDIIISDIFLVGLSGIELLGYVNDHHAHSDVIIMTGYTDRYSYAEIIKLGAIDFMRKPFDMETLEAKLLRALRERQLTKELYLLKNGATGAPLLQAEDPAASGSDKPTNNLWPVELQRLQKKISESELRYQKIFEHAGDFVLLSELTSGKAKIVNVNNACCTAIGYDRFELIGQSVFSFLVDLDQDELDYLRNQMKSPNFENIIFEAKIRCMNQNIIPVEINAVRLEINKLPYILTIARDITENKQATYDLLESESRYRTIFENSAVGFGLSEISSSSPPDSYVDCNETLATFAGLSKEDLTSPHGLSNAYIHEDLSWAKYCEEGFSVSEGVSRYSWIRPDGKENHIVCESKPISLANRQYLLSIHRNVTGRIKADQKIQELSRQMGQAVEKEKKRIAMDLHDELGQKLFCIRRLVDSLQNNIKGAMESNLETSKLLFDLASLVETLGGTCRNIIYQLSPARLEDSEISDIICDLIGFFREICPDKRISAEFESDWGEVDPYTKTVVFRIIQEALNNIVKHSEAKNVKIALKGGSEKRLLTIEDDGIGFDPLAIKKARDTDCSSGGYGLVGMQERVNSVNGQLKFLRKSMGTSIEISLPRRSA